MTRQRATAVALGAVLVAVALLPVIGPVGAATAQQANETAESDDGPTEIEAQVDSRLVVQSYHYNAQNATFYVTLHNRGEQISEPTITERVEPGTGSTTKRFAIERPRLRPGETVEISLDVNPDGSTEGVLIVTPESVDQGKGTYLEQRTGWSLFSGTGSWSDVRAGVIATLATSLLVVLIGAWQYVATKNEDVEEANVDSSKPTLFGRRSDE